MKSRKKLNPEQWVCECGEKLDPNSPEWRCAGSWWEHYHGYPIGHVAVFKQLLLQLKDTANEIR